MCHQHRANFYEEKLGRFNGKITIGRILKVPERGHWGKTCWLISFAIVHCGFFRLHIFHVKSNHIFYVKMSHWCRFACLGREWSLKSYWKSCHSWETDGFWRQCFSNIATVELAKCKPCSFDEPVIRARLKRPSIADTKFVSIPGKFAPRGTLGHWCQRKCPRFSRDFLL